MVRVSMASALKKTIASSDAQNILIVNTGSSSIKMAVFENSHSLPIKLEVQANLKAKHWEITWTLFIRPALKNVKTSPKADVLKPKGLVSHESFENNAGYLSCFLHLLARLKKDFKLTLHAAGHRVVHAGKLYTQHTRISAKVLKNLQKLIPLAPLHQPHNLSAISMLSKQYPSMLQVACFDTVFHKNMPALAKALALPKIYTKQGLQRYGFHGLSYEFICLQLKKLGLLRKKIIIAHLGNGASLCAVKNGISVETSMGFSTLDGLMMGTRPGHLDPGVLLYLLKNEKLKYAQLEQLLYKESGLLGVSGISSDMRCLVEDNSKAAQEAMQLFLYRIRQYIGNFVAVLEGLDVLVFTGGIGEKAASLRASLCKNLAWIGVRLDAKRNKAQGARAIHSAKSSVKVFVIPTNEERVMAIQVRKESLLSLKLKSSK